MTGLKVTLETHNDALMQTVERIHTRIDKQGETLNDIFKKIKKKEKNKTLLIHPAGRVKREGILGNDG